MPFEPIIVRFWPMAHLRKLVFGVKVAASISYPTYTKFGIPFVEGEGISHVRRPFMDNATPDRRRRPQTLGEQQHISMRDLADCLASARGALGSDSSLPKETRNELKQSLEHAEAALRRAVTEKTVFLRIKGLLSDD